MRSSIKKSGHLCAQRSLSTALRTFLVIAAFAACSKEALQPSTLNATYPSDAATDVPLNAKVSAIFDVAMAPLSGTTFVLKQGTTMVAGTVTTSTDGKTATLSPTVNLTASTVYSATISTGATSQEGATFAADRTWTFTTGTVAAETTAPTATGTSPSDGATDVALNAKVAVVFDMPMGPLSGARFTLKQGTTVVAGTVANSADGTSATFKPTTSLTASTAFTATVAAGAMSAVGVAMAADYTWSFTTGTAPDAAAPVVSGMFPAAAATDVAINTRIAATFNKAMDPLSITAATLTVKHDTTAVAGHVTYGPGTTATFTPTGDLAASTLFTVTLTTDVKDLHGNALASASTWTFTTGTTAARGPAPVGLGAAGNFVILAKTAISSVPTAIITGDIGLSPAAETYITGFDPLARDSTNVFSTNAQIVGKAYASNQVLPTPSNLTTAVSNMEAAYTDAAGRPTPDFVELYSGDLGGKTLVPGLYKWTTTVLIPTDVTLSGGPNDVWIFQTTKDLTMSSAKQVTIIGGGLAKNVFWQVAGQVTIGTTSHFEGILLCKTQVSLLTGSTMDGRILAQSQVALQSAHVTQPAQ